MLLIHFESMELKLDWFKKNLWLNGKATDCNSGDYRFDSDRVLKRDSSGEERWAHNPTVGWSTQPLAKSTSTQVNNGAGFKIQWHMPSWVWIPSRVDIVSEWKGDGLENHWVLPAQVWILSISFKFYKIKILQIEKFYLKPYFLQKIFNIKDIKSIISIRKLFNSYRIKTIISELFKFLKSKYELSKSNNYEITKQKLSSDETCI